MATSLKLQDDVVDLSEPSLGLPVLDVEALQLTQGAETGINAIRGQWPGDESDDEVFDALESLS